MVNGQIVIRPIMVVALTYDHRLLDGREGVTFLGEWRFLPIASARTDAYDSAHQGIHRRPPENAPPLPCLITSVNTMHLHP